MERKRAFAYQQLGQHDKATETLKKILHIKRDWFLYSDLGDTLTDRDEKLQAYSLAALKKGDLYMKVNLFNKIILLIDKPAATKEEVILHLVLIARIRLEQGRPFPPALEKELKTKNVDLNIVSDTKGAFKKLMPFWQKILSSGEGFRSGVINDLFEQRKEGFIRAEKGGSFYFRTDELLGNKKNYHRRDRVYFQTADSFNKKRNKPSEIAVNIFKVG